MSLPFLLEIGVEEIPDWMIRPALEHLRQSFAKMLAEHRLGGEVAWVDATPRRLVLRAEDLLPRQADAEEMVSGPPKSAGAGAAAGFAKKMNARVEDLGGTQTAKGEYYCYLRKQPGRAAGELLSESLPGLILGIPWPKTMYWTSKAGARFIRPIRWIVALLAGEVVPFEAAGVRSSNVSSGHRRLGAAHIPVTVEHYQDQLGANYVMVRAEERRKRIENCLAGSRIKPDPGLMDTLVYLTEYPTPIFGGFDPSYLSLPEEVLVTVMRHHQKYFSLLDDTGKLAPRFVAVTNTDGDPEGLIRAGNERVLRARFNDARFFWDTDQHKKLADRVEDLAHVTWQAKVGSYKEKTDRVVALVKELGGSADAQHAALLAKCDLTAEMVKEFTELQGIVGGLYARAQGLPDTVAQAIYDQYLPVSMDDRIPRSRDGQILGIADRLDTLGGFFRLGVIPTGSKDPLGLRRAAQGLVKILVEGDHPHKLPDLLQWAAAGASSEPLEEFIMDRVRYYFRDVRGYDHGQVNSVLKATSPGPLNLANAQKRLSGVARMVDSENFTALAMAFKRIRGILDQSGSLGRIEWKEGIVSVKPSLLSEGPERDLWVESENKVGQMNTLAQQGDYLGALELLASLRDKVDLFFDKVLVNDPNPEIRENRLTLLLNLWRRCSEIADISEIAAPGRDREGAISGKQHT